MRCDVHMGLSGSVAAVHAQAGVRGARRQQSCKRSVRDGVIAKLFKVCKPERLRVVGVTFSILCPPPPSTHVRARTHLKGTVAGLSAS